MRNQLNKRVVKNEINRSLVMPMQKWIAHCRKLAATYMVAPARIAETKINYTICLHEPGLRSDSLVTHVTGNIVTVEAEKSGNKLAQARKKEEYNKAYQRLFSHSFSLPEDANKESLKVNYKEGVVKLVAYTKRVKQV